MDVQGPGVVDKRPCQGDQGRKKYDSPNSEKLRRWRYSELKLSGYSWLCPTPHYAVDREGENEGDEGDASNMVVLGITHWSLSLPELCFVPDNRGRSFAFILIIQEYSEHMPISFQSY